MEASTQVQYARERNKEPQLGNGEAKLSLFCTDHVENPTEPKAMRAKKVMLVKIQETRLMYKNQLYFCLLAMNNWKLKNFKYYL